MLSPTLKRIFIMVIPIVLLAASIFFTLSLTQKDTETRSKAVESDNADIVIVGAGTGGVAAAIQAVRSGSSVILLEETDWVGGQMTAAGVTSMDGGDSRWSGGMYKEFIDTVRQYYQAKGKSISTCYFSNTGICFEPRVGKMILEQMLAAAGIPVHYRTQVLSVQKSGNTITGLTVKQGTSTKTITAKIVIDATEYGDVLPLAGVAYRVGNSISSSPNQNACIQDITYTAVFKKYPGGVPTQLQITSPPPGYTDTVKNKFSAIVTKNGLGSFNGSYPVNWPTHNAYRGMPDSSNPSDYNGLHATAITKTGVNWANDFSVNVRYLQDKTYRKQINCEAKLHTIQFLYYVQTELGEPLWSVANDEGYDTPYNREENDCANIPASLKSIEHHMPVIPYVRESRRAIGSMTLTAKDMKRTTPGARAARTFTSSIAVGDYPVDLHGCMNNENLETDIEAMADHPSSSVSGPFQIPFESLIPNSVNNLIVAEKNISQSRLANGATRLQPITILTGQAAGALAALAAQQGKPPGLIDVLHVQKILTQAKASIEPLVDVPLDHFAHASIQQLVVQGIMSGSGSEQFSPESLLTKAQTAVALLRVIHGASYVPPTVTTSLFTDVPISHWAVHWIHQFAREGITGGCGTGLFCPENPVTRAQLAVFLLRAKHGASYTPPAASGIFTDARGHWAEIWIDELYRERITNGCTASPLNYCPETNVTRATFAVFAMTAFPKTLILPVSTPLHPLPTATLAPTPTTIPTSIPVPTRTPTPNNTATPTPTTQAATPTVRPTVPATRYIIQHMICVGVTTVPANTQSFSTLSGCIGALNTLLATPTTVYSPTATLAPTPTNAPQYSIADLTQDGYVNIIDFTLYMSAWFLDTIETADLNGDNKKTVIDYVIFMNEWAASH